MQAKKKENKRKLASHTICAASSALPAAHLGGHFVTRPSAMALLTIRRISSSLRGGGLGLGASCGADSFFLLTQNLLFVICL